MKLFASHLKLDIDKKCPECKITWNEIQEKGRMGCANDYILFADELKPFLLKYHGSTKYHML